MARPRASNPDTRKRILAAACDEFGAHGFDATTVDRIARRARVNKAMIYYHFSDKRALYACIIRDVVAPIVTRLRAAAAEDAPPDKKLARLIDTLVRSIDESAYFLPIFLREIADGAAHLRTDELALIAGVFGTVSSVIAEGGAQKVFQPIHLALAHFTIIAPLVMFRATAPVRARIRTERQIDIPDADSDTVVRHLQIVAQRMLAPGSANADRTEGGGRGHENTELAVRRRDGVWACQERAPRPARVTGKWMPPRWWRQGGWARARNDGREGDRLARTFARSTRDVDRPQRAHAERAQADASFDRFGRRPGRGHPPG
jgi:AcrR family transcriptional regulator